jgi:hypothetical protein
VLVVAVVLEVVLVKLIVVLMLDLLAYVDVFVRVVLVVKFVQVVEVVVIVGVVTLDVLEVVAVLKIGVNPAGSQENAIKPYSSAPPITQPLPNFSQSVAQCEVLNIVVLSRLQEMYIGGGLSYFVEQSKSKPQSSKMSCPDQTSTFSVKKM